MPEPTHPSLSTVIGKLASVLFQPYMDFIAKLHADGRITDAEIEGLRQEFEDRIPRLAERTQARLREDHESHSPPPGPDQS